MNDPRITSYALGELEGPTCEAFERELAASDDLQKHLNETINLAKALGTLPMPNEQLENRDALLEQCAKNQSRSRKRNILRLVVPISLAAAASLVAVAVLNQAERPESASLAVSAPAEKSANEIASSAPPSPVMGPPPRAAAPVEAPLSVAAATAAPQHLSRTRQVEQPVDVRAAPVAGNVEIAEASQIRDFTGSWRAGRGAGTGVARAAADFEGFIHYGSPIAVVSGADASIRTRSDEWNTEGYNAIRENAFLDAKQNPLSTFSIDVDTASYANVRRFLRDGTLPPTGAIRTEELLNYFPYNDPQPKDAAPFSVNLEVATAPWDAERLLVRIGLKGKEIPASERAPANLVFLVDVSGSMEMPNKLPLLKRSLRALVENLSDRDRVALVVYAGSSGLVLPSTPGTRKQDILAALDNLQAGGGTHGSAGIKLAYETARENFLKEGSNRVILCTDGDFNVGVTSQSELQKLIERERASGVFLSVLGFGTGNVKDSTMELLADKGNGNYAYIDTPNEGRKVLVEQMGSTLFTIAKDVKIQVEFNPARVAAYRLIGYENRLLAKEDFNDDTKDAGEIGAGHTVTALYEIIPVGKKIPGGPSVDPLKYQLPVPVVTSGSAAPVSDDLLTVKLRFKQPDGDKSQLLEVALPSPESVPSFEQASSDFCFAAAVAAFGMKLRGSPNAGNITWDDMLRIGRQALGDDPGSYRAEFLTLIEAAKKLALEPKADHDKSPTQP